MEHARALDIAQSYLGYFLPACERIEIGGSIRRGKADVHDIELVAIPKSKADLFGEPLPTHQLTAMIDMRAPHPNPRNYTLIKSGPKYKQLALPEGINLDLFIVTPPAQWGVLFTLRTGPAEFGHWIVTSRLHGGCMPAGAVMRDGCIYNNGRTIAMPDEIDFLNYLGLGWISPRDRTPQWGRPPVLQVADMPKNPAVMDL